MYDEAAINYSHIAFVIFATILRAQVLARRVPPKLNITICCDRAWSCHKASAA